MASVSKSAAAAKDDDASAWKTIKQRLEMLIKRVVVFRKEWYRKTGKEVMEGRPLLHRLLGFKSRCKGCLKLIMERSQN